MGQTIWLSRVLGDLLQGQEGPIPIYCGNSSTIALSKNHFFHQKSKHIDTRYHFIRELVNNREIYLESSRSKDQLDDMFTKPLEKHVFEFPRYNLGLVNVKAFSCNN